MGPRECRSLWVEVLFAELDARWGMGRRTILLVVAALVAALGTTMVFMYVRGVDARANERFDAVLCG